MRRIESDIRLRQSYEVFGEHRYKRDRDGQTLRVERVSITTNMANGIPPRLNYVEIYGCPVLPNGRLGPQLSEMKYGTEKIPRWLRDLAKLQIERMTKLAGELGLAEKEPR